jgi:hypothetical protein
MLKENAELPRKQRLSAGDIRDNLVKEHGIAISLPYVRLITRELLDAGGDEFIPLGHEIGDAMQIDWLEDVTAIIGGVKTLVQVFVCGLPYSGAVCAFVYPDKCMLSFLHGHVQALSWMGGCPRRCVMDNVKTAVFSGSGKNAVTQDRYKHLALHYAFKPEFCNRASGWEKSNAENGVKITRNKAFTPIPRAESFGDLQDHISAKLLEYNMTHKIEDRPRKIWEMLLEERAALPPLPLSPYEVDETAQSKVYPDQTVRYAKTRYSVPHGYVGKGVTVRVSPFRLRVFSRGELLCDHDNVGEGGPDQYILDHYLESLSRKPRAIEQALPISKGIMPAQCRAFLELCPDKDAKRQLVDLLLLAREIGGERVFSAMGEATATGRPSAGLVRHYIYGQQLPPDAFEIECNNLADYDRMIDGRGAIIE